MRSLPLLFFFSVCLLAACTKDALPEPEQADCFLEEAPTYVNEVKPIIERNCAYSGCHLGGAPGLYDSYEGVLPNLESGIFRQRVIDVRADPTIGMPPEYAPADRPIALTEEELQIISCWLDAGFPQE